MEGGVGEKSVGGGEDVRMKVENANNLHIVCVSVVGSITVAAGSRQRS